ncbi:MAG TPA: hypothetical protein VGC15_14280 [Acetobacteraceae bacterium]
MPPAYLKAPDATLQPEAPFVQGCTGKLQQTREEALRALQRRKRACQSLRDVTGGTQSPGNAYQCHACGFWHTSHVSHWRSARRIRERGE